MKNYSFLLRLLCMILWMLILSVMVHAQLVKQVRLSHFTLQSSAVISAAGDSISSPSYSPNNYWFPVQVPCTVLSGLVQNHVYPDPYQGMNNMLIPDASDSFNHQYQLEPNPSFTYDMKWVVFRSNMFGPSYVFAAEVVKVK